jgi:hypothetical protein
MVTGGRVLFASVGRWPAAAMADGVIAFYQAGTNWRPSG